MRRMPRLAFVARCPSTYYLDSHLTFFVPLRAFNAL
jgi:hypothetical protein